MRGLSAPKWPVLPGTPHDARPRGACSATPALAARWTYAFALASGLLTWLALPPVGAWPLAFVCWTPLLVALRGRTTREALALGGAHGLVVNALGSAWLPHLIGTFVRVSPAVAALLALPLWLYGAGRSALLAGLASRATSRGAPWAFAFVLALVASESTYPLLFPWYAATQVHQVPRLLQVAELGGPTLVGALLACSSVGLAEALSARMERRAPSRAVLAAALAGPALLVAYGAWRVPAVDRAIAAAPTARVGVVQANVPNSGATLAQAITLHRRGTSELTAKGPLDLVIWPEDALSGVVPAAALAATLRRDVAGPLGELPRLASPVLSGALLQRDGRLHNSAVLFEPDGAVDGVYDKMHPLLFGEYLPLSEKLPVLREWLPNAGAVAAGTSDAALVLGEHRVSVLICYESVLHSFANQVARDADPDLLVNLTNDAWFGGASAASLHLAMAELRAVEHRRFLVIASNAGKSEIVDPAGRVVETAPFLEAATLEGTIHWMRARTPYERAGDLAGWLASGIIVLMGLRPPRVLAYLRPSLLSRRHDGLRLARARGGNPGRGRIPGGADPPGAAAPVPGRRGGSTLRGGGSLLARWRRRGRPRTGG